MKNSLDFVIQEFGYEKCISTKRFVYSTKDYYLIHFVLSGEGYFEINQRKYCLERGGLFFIPPNSNANYYPNSQDPWEYIWVGFNGLRAEEFLRDSGLSLEHPVFKSNEPVFLRNLSDLFQCYNDTTIYRDLFLFSIMFKFFYLLSLSNNRLSNEKSSSKIAIINRAKDFISNNYEHDISVKDIANDVAVTPEYLSAIFKSVEGISTITYLKKVRMSVAISLMHGTNLKIKDISAKCGYQSSLYFSNDFKKYYGVNPTEYIKDERRKNQ